MKKNNTSSVIGSKRVYLILFVTVAVLCLPLIAMQFTNQVKWELPDFFVAGFLLLATGFAVDLILRKFKKAWLRAIAIGLIILTFILIWVELAVGIFNTALAGD